MSSRSRSASWRSRRRRASEPADLDFLCTEYVGNLVCPALYDLGEDKPLKYPTSFKRADVAVITKIDFEYIAFLEARLEESRAGVQ